MAPEIDDMEIGQEVVIKDRRATGREGCRSKIYMRLLECLQNGSHLHMLKYCEDESEFEVKLTDKKSPYWEVKDISLCEDLDSVFSKRRKPEKYYEGCKGRFKANMQKLCDSEYLEFLGSHKIHETTWKKYRILKHPKEDKPVMPDLNRKRKKPQRNRNNVVADASGRLKITTAPEISFGNGPNTGSLGYSQIAVETPPVCENWTNGVSALSPSENACNVSYTSLMKENVAMGGDVSLWDHLQANGTLAVTLNKDVYNAGCTSQVKETTIVVGDLQANGILDGTFNKDVYNAGCTSQMKETTILANGILDGTFNKDVYNAGCTSSQMKETTILGNDLQANGTSSVTLNKDVYNAGYASQMKTMILEDDFPAETSLNNEELVSMDMQIHGHYYLQYFSTDFPAEHNQYGNTWNCWNDYGDKALPPGEDSTKMIISGQDPMISNPGTPFAPIANKQNHFGASVLSNDEELQDGWLDKYCKLD